MGETVGCCLVGGDESAYVQGTSRVFVSYSDSPCRIALLIMIKLKGIFLIHTDFPL